MSSALLPLALALAACGGDETGDTGATGTTDSQTADTLATADTEDTGSDTGPTDTVDTSPTGDSGGGTRRTHNEHPNLLLVLLDDVGTDKVSSYLGDYAAHGYAPRNLPATPVIDDLAASGVRFTHAWANPQCSPTRAALHTGEHPFRTGVGAPIPPAPELDTDQPTLAEALSATHRTGVFGKWHLGSSGAASDSQRTLDLVSEATGYTPDAPGTFQHTANPLLHGFSRFAGGLQSSVCVGQGSGPCVGTYTDWVQVYSDVNLTAKGEDGAQQLTLAWQETTFATEEVVNQTLDWVGEVSEEGPWFASVNFHAAHTPHEDQTAQGCTTSAISADDLRTDPGMYQSMVECLDTWLGELLGGLDALGELDGTLVVVVGDNGTPNFAGEGPFAENGRGKATTFESGVRVPFVVADGAAWREHTQGVPPATETLVASPGRVEARPVHTTDLYATLTHAGGVELSATGQDSESFLDLLQNPEADGPERYVYAETFQEQEGMTRGWAALKDRTGMKLLLKVLPYTEVPGTVCIGRKLYDTASDPLEDIDLQGDPAHAGAQQDLENALAVLIAEGATWLDVDTPCP